MSKIEWTDEVWNWSVGCTKASAGCRYCYAMGDSPSRFAAVYDRPDMIAIRTSAGDHEPGLTYTPKDVHGKSLGKGAQWTGEIRLLPWVLEKPLRWRKPRKIFVNSLSDMFHQDIVGCEKGRRFIAAAFGVMAATPQHTYQILTKRPEQAVKWFKWLGALRGPEERKAGSWSWDVPGERLAIQEIVDEDSESGLAPIQLQDNQPRSRWPLPNVWIGTSVENQEWAHRRIPALLQVPAALRFLSCEPLLGPIDLDPLVCSSGCSEVSHGEPGSQPWCAEHDEEMGSSCWLDPDQIALVIAGGESGGKARPCEVAWLRSIVDQCKAAEVPVFIKQLGASPVAHDLLDCGPGILDLVEPFPAEGITLRLGNRKGGDMDEWPADLRVREMPEAS